MNEKNRARETRMTCTEKDFGDTVKEKSKLEAIECIKKAESFALIYDDGNNNGYIFASHHPINMYVACKKLIKNLHESIMHFVDDKPSNNS